MQDLTTIIKLTLRKILSFRDVQASEKPLMLLERLQKRSEIFFILRCKTSG
ncbi:hypothetical protein PJE062_4963 [Pseudovibrio sp. JE062]|nr:hypothetical protein PJE062_4963 [Pseudovibrio sp. JE062]